MGQPAWFTAKIDADGQLKMKSVQKDYMIFNYCTDTKGFPSGFAPECAVMRRAHVVTYHMCGVYGMQE